MCGEEIGAREPVPRLKVPLVGLKLDQDPELSLVPPRLLFSPGGGDLGHMFYSVCVRACMLSPSVVSSSL